MLCAIGGFIHYMDELYVEQIVEKKLSAKDQSIKFLGIAVPVLFILAGFFTSNLLITAGVLLGVVAYFFMSRLNVEYEYLYLSKELTIDKIFNKEKRKKAVEYQLEQMEIMAPVKSHSLDSYNNRIAKTLDFSSGDANANVYALIINDNGYVKLLIEPSQELIHAIKGNYPRKVVEY